MQWTKPLSEGLSLPFSLDTNMPSELIRHRPEPKVQG